MFSLPVLHLLVKEAFRMAIYDRLAIFPVALAEIGLAKAQ